MVIIVASCLKNICSSHDDKHDDGLMVGAAGVPVAVSTAEARYSYQVSLLLCPFLLLLAMNRVVE